MSIATQVVLPFAVLLGLLVGSFLNVCIHRLPRDLSVVHPRSACPRCHGVVAWYDNVPLLSYLWLGARCRRCSTPISPLYPAIEAANATLYAELCATGRPAILVPYPHAADDHQFHNAETLRKAGAAEVIRDGELDGPALSGAIADLAGNAERRREMGRAARSLARPDAAESIADVADRLMKGGLDEKRDVS